MDRTFWISLAIVPLLSGIVPHFENPCAYCADESKSPGIPAPVAAALLKDLPALTYLANVDIQRELGIQGKQQTALNSQVEDFFRQWVPLQAEERRLQASGKGEAELKAIQAKRLTIMTSSSAQALRQLSPAQAERFHQLLFQFRGIEFLLEPSVREAARISEEEVKAIQESRRWVGEQGNKLNQEIKGKKAGEQDLARRIVKLRQEGWSRLEPRLLPERQRLVTSWRGKPASFEEHRLKLQIHDASGGKKKSK